MLLCIHCSIPINRQPTGAPSSVRVSPPFSTTLRNRHRHVLVEPIQGYWPNPPNIVKGNVILLHAIHIAYNPTGRKTAAPFLRGRWKSPWDRGWVTQDVLFTAKDAD